MTELQQPQKSNLLRRLPIILALLPALIPFYPIYHDGVNMPYWDEWDHGFVDMAIKAYHGSVSWADLVAPHNEHRIIVPKLIYLVLTWLTSWNEFALMYFGWLVAVVTSIFVGVLCFKTALNRGRALATWFLCNLLMFSPTQWENWLAGYGMINFLPMMFITAGFVILIRDTAVSPVLESGMAETAMSRKSFSDWSRVITLILLATAATYSSLQGFLAWPLIGVLLAWPGSIVQSKNRTRVLITWIVLFIFNIVLYLIGYHADTAGDQAHTSVGMIDKIKFGLAYLGNPFFINSLDYLRYAIAVGSLMLMLIVAACAIAIYLWRVNHDAQRAQQYLIWLLLGGYTLATALLAVMFRSSVGMQMSLAGRYVTSTIYLPIALINLLPMLWDDLMAVRPTFPRIRRPATIIAALLFISLYGLSGKIAWDGVAFATRVRRAGKGALLTMDIARNTDLLGLFVYPRPEEMYAQAREMSTIGYLHPPLITERNPTKYLDPHPDPSPYSTFGAIGVSNRVDENRLLVAGWAVLPRRRLGGNTIVLTYDDPNTKEPLIFTLAIPGASTPELVSLLNDSHYSWCGWWTIVPLNGFSPAIKTIRIRAWSIDADSGLSYLLTGDATVAR